MNHKSIYAFGLAVVAASFALSSCKPDLHADAASAGGLNFARYVAVGNSLTAGYADGSLYRSGQINSYPAVLAEQFRMLGGGDFKQPLLPGEAGWYTPKRVLEFATDCQGKSSPSPVLYHGVMDTAGSSINVYSQGPYNNTGIPGIRAIDYLLPPALYGSLNPYAGRLLSNTVTGTIAAEINRADATFFTAWIGNNDVLGYATSGGAGKSSGGTFLDQNSISSTALFSVAVDSVLNRMTKNGAKGAVMNIPDVTAIPYFTTISPIALMLNDTNATALNAAYAGTGVRFTTGANRWVIQDTSVPVIRFRQIRSDEFLLLTLPQDSIKCGGWGTRKPIPMQYVLDTKEAAAVRTATATFNTILQNAAAARGLAYVDMNSYLRSLATGIGFNGNNFSTTFVSGGAFSLDGVHLTPRGYALAANEMIRTINAFYGSTIPMADVNSRPGIILP